MCKNNKKLILLMVFFCLVIGVFFVVRGSSQQFSHVHTPNQFVSTLLRGTTGSSAYSSSVSAHADQTAVTSGIPAVGLFGYNSGGGAGAFDAIPGDATNGLSVSVSGSGGGTSFLTLKKTDVTNDSYNFPFGFTSNKIILETAAANTEEIVVDWLGGTAVTPVADATGDDLIPAGRTITLDPYNTTSISVKAATTGNQTVYIRAFE